jgi:hypothetical protein
MVICRDFRAHSARPRPVEGTLREHGRPCAGTRVAFGALEEDRRGLAAWSTSVTRRGPRSVVVEVSPKTA